LGLHEIKSRMDVLEAEQVKFWQLEIKTPEWIDGAIRDLQEFMQSAIKEHEAMDIDRANKDDMDTEKKDMEIAPRTGKKRDRSDAQSAVTGDGLRLFVNESGQILD